MTTWIYQNQSFSNTPTNFESFVYIITNQITQKKYIGKKIFWSTKTLPPLKGQTKKRKIKSKSDWETYYGSSEELKSDIEQLGEENFTREILYLCETRAISSYLEAKLQFQFEVLLKPDEFYNKNIMCKIHSNHVKRLNLNN